MYVHAVGVMLGFAVLKGHLGCVGSVQGYISECGAPCVRAAGAVRGPGWVLGPLVCTVCAVVGAARAAAVRRKAGGEAVQGVPVRPRADG